MIWRERRSGKLKKRDIKSPFCGKLRFMRWMQNWKNTNISGQKEESYTSNTPIKVSTKKDNELLQLLAIRVAVDVLQTKTLLSGSIHCLGSQPGGYPDIALPSHNFQLFLGDPEVFPGQMGCIVPPASSESISGSPPRWGVSGKPPTEGSQQASWLDAWTTSMTARSSDSTPHPFSKAEPAIRQRTIIPAAILSFRHYR